MLMVTAGLVLVGLVALDTGPRGVALFALGGALGAVFLGFQYGFASAWRRFLVVGEATGLAAHFLRKPRDRGFTYVLRIAGARVGERRVGIGPIG